VLRIIKSKPNKIIEKIKHNLNWKNMKKKRRYSAVENDRISVFKEFSSLYLNETKYNLNNQSDMKSLETYDKFITCSDQVWHPAQYLNFNVFFLNFAPSPKRIAYAPSFAVEKIPDIYKNKYKDNLEQMSHVSVRESAGAKIIKDL